MLKKTRSAETGKTKVTFVLSSQPSADHIHVAGDFNDWQASTPMKRQKDGSWRATVDLEPGREYQFRYLVDGNNWVNDEAADAWVPNPFGADNSVVRTPEAEGGRPGARSAGSKAGAASGRSKASAGKAGSPKAGAGKSGGANAGAGKAGSPKAGAGKSGGTKAGGAKAPSGAGATTTGGAKRSPATGASGRSSSGRSTSADAGTARQNGSRKAAGGTRTRGSRTETGEG